MGKFVNLCGDRQLLVAPILQTLILSRAPQATLAWANQVAQWDFTRIIPCHFDAPITATPQQFRSAFDFLEQSLPADEDGELLRQIDDQLTWWRIIVPAKKL